MNEKKDNESKLASRIAVYTAGYAISNIPFHTIDKKIRELEYQYDVAIDEDARHEICRAYADRTFTTAFAIIIIFLFIAGGILQL